MGAAVYCRHSNCASLNSCLCFKVGKIVLGESRETKSESLFHNLRYLNKMDNVSVEI